MRTPTEPWEAALKQYEEGVQKKQDGQASAARRNLLRELPKLASHANTQKIWAAANKADDAELRHAAYQRTAQLTDLSHWHPDHAVLDFENLKALYEYHNDPAVQDADEEKVQSRREQTRPPTPGPSGRRHRRPSRYQQYESDAEDDHFDLTPGPSHMPPPPFPLTENQDMPFRRQAPEPSPSWTESLLQPSNPRPPSRQNRAPSPVWSESFLPPGNPSTPLAQTRAPSPAWSESFLQPRNLSTQLGHDRAASPSWSESLLQPPDPSTLLRQNRASTPGRSESRLQPCYQDPCPLQMPEPSPAWTESFLQPTRLYQHASVGGSRAPSPVWSDSFLMPVPSRGASPLPLSSRAGPSAFPDTSRLKPSPFPSRVAPSPFQVTGGLPPLTMLSTSRPMTPYSAHSAGHHAPQPSYPVGDYRRSPLPGAFPTPAPRSYSYNTPRDTFGGHSLFGGPSF
ncbi:hypothetical protein P389DRAFT_81574 [Cystobasidium minutum MCA 4210]|uniref:uncharacterized protein n=1 Tax=Cystobasidium minutum MCA 4210 TaxID=1397322 RepID=UPI0034CD45C0|eukprot:jgi/Rhomi1/81574/CE81573_168